MAGSKRAPRVLVIDAQRPIRELIDQCLSARGYEVAVVPTLDSARVRLADERPDLVICDAKVPGAPVFPILDLLDADEQTRHLPVLLCTGVIAEVEASPERLIRPGTALLLKPFAIDELLVAADRLARPIAA